MNDPRHKLLVLDSRVEGRVQEIRATRDWWPCRPGCACCCRHLANPPELSREEWVRVDEAVAALPASVRTEIEQKIAALLTQIAENKVGKHVVCPYLDEVEASCRIYEARPIACRTYGFFVARDREQYCEMIQLPRLADAEVGDFSSPRTCSSSEQASPEPPGWFKSSPKTEIFFAPFSSASPIQPQ